MAGGHMNEPRTGRHRTPCQHGPTCTVPVCNLFVSLHRPERRKICPKDNGDGADRNGMIGGKRSKVRSTVEKMKPIDAVKNEGRLSDRDSVYSFHRAQMPTQIVGYIRLDIWTFGYFSGTIRIHGGE